MPKYKLYFFYAQLLNDEKDERIFTKKKTTPPINQRLPHKLAQHPPH